MNPHNKPGILIEAEAFENYGGWVLDSQFASEMGSLYLLAHGLGRPVADATTVISVTDAGEYELWVRAKDWVPSHHPGRFELLINGKNVEVEFGANGKDWSWQSAGMVSLPNGEVKLALHDLTGFNGRCDAIYFSADGQAPPNEFDETSRAWRKKLRGVPAEPVDAGAYDVVVVGGGVSGCAAALTAARLGQRVALIQDRPVLGGNASNEIGLMPRGAQGELLKELSQRTANGDLVALSLLEAEPNASIFLEQRVFAVAKDEARIVSVDAVHARTGLERRFRGSIFIDASGIAMIGVLAGAETHIGREARAEFNEPYAPETADDMHHGNTLFFRTRMADEPVPFPEVPWATEVAKDYANLSGQLIKPGVDNGLGPIAGENPATPEFRFGRKADVFPATHFWEHGQWLDPYKTGERVRDYLMRALYGTFSNVKKLDPEQYANLEFEWMAHVSAKGEYRRYRGDYVLSEIDIRNHTVFEDALIANDGSFCIHCAWEEGEGKYDFRLKDWIFDQRDKQSYTVPFRCLYSVNIDNLMMAGKHISTTHIAASSTKFMGNGAQHGIAVAVAAALCNLFETTPRGIYEEHLDRLKGEVRKLTACDHDLTHHPPQRNFAPVPG
ncbi:MAG: FAD-dependent oxidoreductase [Chloroflexota bacterium]